MKSRMCVTLRERKTAENLFLVVMAVVLSVMTALEVHARTFDITASVLFGVREVILALFYAEIAVELDKERATLARKEGS